MMSSLSFIYINQLNFLQHFLTGCIALPCSVPNNPDRPDHSAMSRTDTLLPHRPLQHSALLPAGVRTVLASSAAT